MEYTDQTLVEEIRGGSSIAFEHLMRRYERVVYRIAFSHTRNPENALDITQNVFIKVHQKLPSLRKQQHFKAWVVRITYNESLNWIRSQSRHEGHDELHESFSTKDSDQEDRLLRREWKEKLLDEMVELNPKQRLAVALRYFESMSIREISQVLKCSEGVVKNILFRSLRKLRAQLVSMEMPI